MRRTLLFAAVPLLLVLGFVAVFAVSSGSAQPQAVTPGTTIRTDKTQYRVGELINICYSIPPGATPIIITDRLADGTLRTLLSGVDDGTGGCFNGTVTPPTGTECLRIEVFSSSNTSQKIGDSQTCFRVIPAVGPLPPPSTPVSITTDRRQYIAGDVINVCYTVTGTGTVSITNLNADGTAFVILNQPASNSSGCARATAGPAIGNECMRADFLSSAGIPSQAQTCYQVLPPFQPQPVFGTTLRTDRQAYSRNQPMQLCYTVPAQGLVVIRDNNGQTVYSGIDNGTGGCVPGVAPGTPGRACYRLTVSGAAIPVAQSADACFTVV
jgi:hypothetical protein